MSARWHDPAALFDFLDYLSHEGYRLDMRHYAAAQDLMLTLAARGERVDSVERAVSWLVPLLCCNQEEQEAFSGHFTFFFLTRAAALPPEPEFASLADVATTQGQKREARTRAVTSIAKTVGGLAALWLFVMLLSVLIGPLIVDMTQTKSLRTLPFLNLPIPRFDLLRPSVASELLLTIVLSVGVLGGTLLAIPMWRLAQRGRFLRRLTTREQPELQQIPLHASAHLLFKRSEVSRLARNLRHHRKVATHWLDVEATVRETLSRHGWLTPVYAKQQVTPDYLVLIERWSLGDHQAHLADVLLDVLAEQNVFIDRYYFRHEPLVLFQTGSASASISLEELMARHPDHRLIIVTDGCCLLNPYTGILQNWTEKLKAWPERSLWTPRPKSTWGREEATLRQLFQVLPFGANPVWETSLQAESGPQSFGSREPFAMPATFREQGARWLGRQPMDAGALETGLAALHIWLGTDTYAWFAACALFPNIHWHVTLYLGTNLLGPDGMPLLNLERLVNLCRLPWFRTQIMPEWLRERLVSDLPRSQEQAVRDVLNELLIGSLSASGANFELELARYPRPFLRHIMPSLISKLHKRSASTSPLRDRVFVRFLRGSRLAVTLPRMVWVWLQGRGDPYLGVEARRAINLVRGSVMCAAATLVVMGLATVTEDQQIAMFIAFSSLLFGPGFLLGNSAYHGLISGQIRDNSAIGLYWFLLVFVVVVGGGLFVLLFKSVSEALMLIVILFALPVLIIGGAFLGVEYRAGIRYHTLSEEVIKARRQAILRVWMKPQYVLFGPIIVGLALLLGLHVLPLAFAAVVPLAGLITCTLGISAASFMLITAGFHSRSHSISRLGMFYQFPFLLYWSHYVVQQMLGLESRAITELFYAALIVYCLFAGLIVQPWRKEILIVTDSVDAMSRC